jgi:tRNA (guanine-N7-)-methyltransferase
MRIRKKKWAEPELSVCNFYVKNPEENAGKWMQAFKKEQPLYLESAAARAVLRDSLRLKIPTKTLSHLTSRLICSASAEEQL